MPRTERRPLSAPVQFGEASEEMTEATMDAFLETIRRECAARWVQRVLTGAVPPIRGMARLTREARDLAFAECARRGLARAEAERVVAAGIIDRTIGDVDVRAVTEPGFTDLAEELGVIIPGENATGGDQYRRMHARMRELELELLQQRGFDLRMYDIYGVGNPRLREQLRDRMIADYGLEFPIEQIFVSLGGIHSMDRAIRMLRKYFADRGKPCVFGFPAPGWAVAKWQAEVTNLPVCLITTREDADYKLTPHQLTQLFADVPDLRVLYLAITNNPTAYSYTPDELTQLAAVIATRPDVMVLADLAYIGTAEPAMDKARMQVFKDCNLIAQTIFISSLSKVMTLTGDRFGWASFGTREIADLMSLGWNNFSAGLPREWQLSFMTYLELYETHPELGAKIRALYTLRRQKLIAQLHALNQTHDVFIEIGRDEGGGIYNWSKLQPGETVFSLFEKTGLAGVPGSAFGYSDKFVRFSVGIVPP